MKLSDQLENLLQEVWSAERICRRYQPKNPARDAHFRLAASGYDAFADHLQTLLEDHGHLLRGAEEAELVAESDEVRP